MNHIDEDIKLKYILDILDEDVTKIVTNHLAVCDICSSTITTLEKQMDVIGSFDPIVENEFIPKNQQRIIKIYWVKRAAILIIGFLLGYFTSEILKPKQVVIVGQNFIPQTNEFISSNFIDCPCVDIFTNNTL